MHETSQTQLNTNCKTQINIIKRGIAGQRLKLLTLTESFIAFFLKIYTG